MDDEENPAPSGSRQQLSFSLEPEIPTGPKLPPRQSLTLDEIKRMDEIAQNLSKHGCSFLESTVCGKNGCPESLKEDVKYLYDRINIAVGPLMVNCDPRGRVFPQIIGLSDLNKSYLKCVLRGAGSFEDFILNLKKFHSAIRCNVVWRQNTVAYRCHTCGLNSCMSLCAQCFEEADHENHDYSRFFSTVGGCCDCGNPDVMEPKGFCPRHRENAPKKSDNIPPHSLALLKTVIAKLISRMLVCLRRWTIVKHSIGEYNDYVNSGNPFTIIETNETINRGILSIINIISELSEAGSAVTDMLIEFLLDKNFYKELCRIDLSPLSGIRESENVEAPDWRLLPELKTDMDTLANLRCIRNLIPDKSSLHPLTIECVLDELILYLIRIAFPQELIDMLLNLLYDTKYKEHFAKKFFSFYPYITAMVAELLTELQEGSREGGKVAERIVHISVQICSGSNICTWLQKEIDIIRCVIQSAIMMSLYKSRPTDIDHSPERFYSTLPGDMATRHESGWLCVSITENPYYDRNADLFVLTDTQNLLVHQPIAKTLFASEHLIDLYIRHIELFQGFITEWRIPSGDHRPQEWQIIAQRSYNVEFEACSIPMHNLLQHATTYFDCEKFLQILKFSLNKWFTAINFDRAPTDTYSPPYLITFHLPLHRHLATLIFQMQTSGFECKPLLENLRMDQTFLKKILIHPLRIHVARAQSYASMWIRNGHGMRIAVSHYCKPTITFSFQSADLILLRFAASNINQEFFLTCLYNSFSIPDCINYPADQDEINVDEDSRNLVIRKAWVDHLVDGVLRLLLDLIIGRRDTEPDSDELLKEEMVALLARQDLPYSHVKDVIPSRGNICFDKQMEVFDKVLAEISNFVQADQNTRLEHARHELKPENFKNLACPVTCRLRSFGSLDFAEYMNRADNFEKEKSQDLPNNISPWLGYRMYNFDEIYLKRFDSVKEVAALLTQPSFFALMHHILDRVIETNIYSALVLQQTIYLLTLSVQFIKSNLFNECKSKLFHPNEYNEPAIYTEAHQKSVRNSENPRMVVTGYFLKDFKSEKKIVIFLIQLFIGSVKARFPLYTDRELWLTLQRCIEPVNEKELERIHGGAMEYIGRLLNVLMTLDNDIRTEVNAVIESALPSEPVEIDMEVDTPASSSSTTSNNLLSSSPKSTKDKKAKARAKKDALLKSLQAKGAALMKHHMETEGITQNEMDLIDTKTVEEKTYLCPICSEETNHSLANPLGVFVHTRPNAVIPNSVSADEDFTDIMQLAPVDKNASIYSREKIHLLPRKILFDKKDNLCIDVYPKNGSEAVRSLKFKTGIEVRTCSHFAHLSCFKGYVNSMVNNSPVIRIDFTVACPMCRTPINTILPLKMEYGREKVRANFEILNPHNIHAIKKFYIDRLNDPRPRFNDETLKIQTTEYRQTYEEFEDIAYRQLLNCSETNIEKLQKRFKGYPARLGFAQSNVDKLIMFTSLDYQIPQFSKGSVIEHILSGAVTLSLHIDQSQILSHFNWLIDSMAGNDFNENTEMPPLLLCDFQSLYIRCAAVPFIDERFVDEDRKKYCILLYRIITTLCLTRAIQNTICKSATIEAVNEFIQKANFGCADILSRGLEKVFETLKPIFSDTKERLFIPPESFKEGRRIAFDSLEHMIKYTKEQAELILNYFMQFVFMLDKEITKQDLTDEEKVKFKSNNFEILYSLVYDSNDGTSDIAIMSQCSRYFIGQFIHGLNRINSEKLLQIVISETFNWRYRRLLNLPKLYDKLFSAFFGQKCENCNRQPRHQMLCLLCGSIMCLNKCQEDEDRLSETETYIERHTVSCGAGCCCYLSLNTTMIVINYYRQANLWGTVYMDAHGEEDRNLIRGKPLFLSEPRETQLKHSWMTQDLDKRANLHWFALDQLSAALRQSHHHNF